VSVVMAEFAHLLRVVKPGERALAVSGVVFHLAFLLAPASRPVQNPIAFHFVVNPFA